MHTFNQFVQVIKNEIQQTKVADVELLTAIGLATADLARNMVGRPQSFWQNPNLMESTIDEKRRKGLGMGGDPSTPLYATGAFRRDIGFKVNPFLKMVSIGSNVPYVKYTEYGTSHMAPRPVFTPAFLKTLPAIAYMIKRLYLQGLKH